MKHGNAILNDTPMGIIIPPPEIRKIIDKAAELVGRYGSSIEATFQNEEKNLPKFSFLREGDPYRPYYLHKSNEIARENSKNENNPNSKLGPSGKIRNLKDLNDLSNKNEKFLGRKINEDLIENEMNLKTGKLTKPTNNLQDDLRKIIEEKKVNKFNTNEIKAPPKDEFSISHPNISSLDMDVIKITAQFVARNGQKFLTGLSEREIRNPQFDFLKPQHNLFGYFTYLVESYAKCLRKDEGNKANLYFNDGDTIIKRATERYLWEKKQKEILKKKDAVDENERNHMAQIDWYDFAIVEVIDFTEEELYNTVPILHENDTTVNMNINSIQANVDMIMKTNTRYGINHISLQEEEKFMEDFKYSIENKAENINEITTNQEYSEDIPEPGMKIVKNYKRKIPENISAKKDQVKCPLCKEFILIDDWPQHIKVELLDPKWREIQKELSERKIEMSLAPNSDFVNYLSDFSRYRPDLFGDVKDVVKIEERKKTEAKAPNSIWDGIAPNISRTTANIAMLFQQNRKNIEESMKTEGSTGGVRGNIPVNFVNITGQQQGENVNRLQLQVNQQSISSGQSNLNTNAIPISVSKQNPKLNSNPQGINRDSHDITKNLLTGYNSLNTLSSHNLKNSEGKFIPEELFLMKNNKPFKLNIKLPSRLDINKNYKGQIITVIVDPKESIESLKSNLKKDLGENSYPQDIILKTLNDYVLEDNRSFAYYNLTNNSFIELDV